MDIFVRTRGLQLNQDYEWVKVDESCPLVEKPPLQINKSQAKIEIDDLLETKDFSIAIARNEKEIILYVTGLATQFKDPYNTSIRNSICWVINEQEEESKIRALAVNFLENRVEIENVIKECIKRNSDGSISIDVKKIVTIASDIDSSQFGNNKIPSQLKPSKIEKDSNNNKEALIKILKENKLPEHQNVLVIVTTKKLNTNLKKAEVWRGLTDTFDDIKPSNYHWFKPIFSIIIFTTILVSPVIIIIRAINPPEMKPIPALQIFYTDSNLDLQISLSNSNINMLYYRGGFSEKKITGKLEGIPIFGTDFSKKIESIDGPNPSKANTDYKFLISDRQIEDEDLRQVFQSSTASQCLDKVEKIDQYPVTLCITTPK